MINNYFQLIKKDDSKLQEVLEYFEEEYLKGKEEIKINGILNQNISELSSLFENRFSQLQELEAILSHYNNKLNGIRGNIYRDLQEHSKRQLTSTDIKQYVDSDAKVLAMNSIINEITLVRNKFISLTKGMETKNWQLSNIVKLQCAGLDNIII